MYTMSPAGASTDDARALIDLVAALERSQQHEDVEGFLALFDPAAVWVNGAGRRLIGLDVIAAFTRQVLPGGMGAGSVTYEVEHISFISPDVALTGVRQQYTDSEGRPLDDSAGSPSYVWRRTGETWRIVAGQNTGVQAS